MGALFALLGHIVVQVIPNFRLNVLSDLVFLHVLRDLDECTALSEGLVGEIFQNYADRTHRVGEYAGGDEHYDCGANNFDLVRRCYVSIPHGCHSHGGPVEGLVVANPNGGLSDAVLLEPGNAIVLSVCRNIVEHAGRDVGVEVNLGDQDQKVEEVA